MIDVPLDGFAGYQLTVTSSQYIPLYFCAKKTIHRKPKAKIFIGNSNLEIPVGVELQ